MEEALQQANLDQGTLNHMLKMMFFAQLEITGQWVSTCHPCLITSIGVMLERQVFVG